MTDRPSLPTLLLRGVTKRCARCGGGRLFTRWFTMKEDCPTCGLHFEREEGFFLGAYVVSIGVTQLVVVAYIAVGFALTLPDPPVGAMLLLAVPVVLVSAVLSYPFSKTVWTAIDFLLHPRPRG